jgi:hypothetical protein
MGYLPLRSLGLLLAAFVQDLMDAANRNAKGSGKAGDGFTALVSRPDLRVSA